MDYGQTNWRRSTFFTAPENTATRWRNYGAQNRIPYINHRWALETTRPESVRHGASDFRSNIQRRSSVQCFRCNRPGHIAKHCPLQNQRTKTKLTVKRKSDARRKRDYNRLVQFRDRKSICIIMPFYEVPNTDLSACVPRYVERGVSKATAKVVAVTSALNLATVEVSALKAENTNLVCETRSLTERITSLDNLCKEKNIEIKNLSVKLERLEDKYEYEIEEREFAELRVDNILEEFDDLERRYASMEMFAAQAKLQVEKLLEKEILNSNQPNKENHLVTKETPCQRPTPDNKQSGKLGNRKCRRCGSETDHHPRYREDCPAFFANCSFCRKRGHFLHVCR